MIIKFIIFILCLTTNIFSKNITIKADLVHATKNHLRLNKNILIKIDKNIITGNKADCILKKFTIITCEFVGNLQFTIFHANKIRYKGQANSLKYTSKSNTYVYSGNVVIEDKINKSIMKGDKIKINMNKNGNLEIKGTKNKPVDINFNL